MARLSKKLAAQTKKFECLFCDGECTMEAYRNEKVEAVEVEAVLALWKVCVPHAQELDRLHTEKEKREIARSVA